MIPRNNRKSAPALQEKAKAQTVVTKNAKKRVGLFEHKELPYLVTILFAILAWSVTHTVDRLADFPIVKMTKRMNGQRFDVELENITQNRDFADLNFAFVGATQDDHFSDPRSEIRGGGWDGNVNLTPMQDAVQIMIPHFLPEWRLGLTATYSGHGEPRVQLIGSKEPVIFAEPGIRTLLIQYELHILSFLALVSVALIVGWFWARRLGRGEV